ncbi:hypothetical protein GF343_04625 [Candidatus Woesearchaeota archaeon]|nr:hypothetical protein [Candidatus Woesearchaeota archaeon]
MKQVYKINEYINSITRFKYLKALNQHKLEEEPFKEEEKFEEKPIEKRSFKEIDII